MKKLISLFILLTLTVFVNAQDIKNNPGSNHGNKFEQLGTILPTPNEYRTASGAPGPQYWQQRCDYDIVCELDEPNRKLSGKETITYYNNPLWIGKSNFMSSSRLRIGSVRYYNRALTAGEAAINFAATKTRFGL